MSAKVNQQVRVGRGHHGELVVLGAWCGRCRREVMPREDGSCSWCQSVIVDESTLSARAMLEQLNGGNGATGRELLDRMDAGEPVGLEEAEHEGSTPIESEPEAAIGAAAVVGHSASSSPKVKWTREKVIEAIREVGEKVGRTPTNRDMADAGYISVTVNTTLNGLGSSWAELVAEAGYEPRGKGQTAAKVSGRAARLAPATRRGNTAARPQDSEQEPQAEQAVDRAVPARTVSSPGPTEPEAASRSDDHLSENAVRDPIPTAAIPYDADVLEDEATFLRRRALALEELACGIRALASLGAEVEDVLSGRPT